MSAIRCLAESRALVEAALDRLLPAETAEPAELHRAMRYAVFAGGKRLRPALALAAGRLGDLAPEALAGPAGALEMIHTYSLVHDDLPAMDDDTLRRGKPTCHVVFGEALAILAGDALLTHAFEVLARLPDGDHLSARRAEAVRRVALAAGPAGMVGGQVLDLEAGRQAGGGDAAARLAEIHARKTGALLGASVALGAVLGGLTPADCDRLDRFGRIVGLAFQITDDVLDVEGTDTQLGKTAGKDARQDKLTFPAVHGLEESRRHARRLLEEALDLIAPWGDRAAGLGDLARFAVERRS